MLSDVFIRRPVLATVCSLLIILAGAISIPTLPIARYPDLVPPGVTVSAFYTGANAQAVESAVTTPLEQVINGVEGMTYITSSSTNSGLSTITVTFDIGRNPDLAAVDVQNRVNQALGRMPAEVRTNGITVTKNTSGFMGGLGFYSKDNRYSTAFISNYLDVYVRDALKRVPGVGNVLIFGERKYAMRLWLDPQKLAARQISAGDVVTALREQNVQVAAGAVGDAPADVNQLFTISVRAAGRLTEASQFENVVVKAGADGALVRVSDVGRVELGAETYASNLRFLGLNASGVGIQLLPSANALEVFDGVMTQMKRLERNFPPGLEWRLAFDNVVVVRESIVEVLKTLAEAILLVILVMFLFLQNWRSTVIPAITIPVSLIGTFAFIKLFGFSINTLTLFGIVLATGIVVDDAIVVIENIERHMSEYKKGARQAAHDAMREVFSAVVVIGLVLVAVFVPVAFFPGTTGRLYQQFSLTIAFSVVLSVFNAVTLTPALSALLLDRETHAHGRFFRGVNRVIDAGTRGYVSVLRFSLTHRFVLILFFVASLGPDLARVPLGADVVRAVRGRRLLPVDRAGAGRRLARVHDAGRRAGREDPVQGSGHPGRVLGDGLQLQRRGAEQRADLHAAQAVRRAPRRGALAGRGPGTGARAARRDPGRDDRGVPAAGDPGPVGVRRLPVRGPRSDGRADLGPDRDTRGARAGQREVDPGGRRVLDLPRQRPAARGDDRSRSRPQPRRAAARGHRRPAGVRRLAVRQRLRLQQPRLSRLRAGRSARSGRSRPTSASSTCGRRPARSCGSTTSSASPRSRRRRSSITSTCSGRPRSAATPRPASARARRSPRWSGSRAKCCRPASTSPGPARRWRK